MTACEPAGAGEAAPDSEDIALRRSRDELVDWERSAGLFALRWRDVPLWRLIRNTLFDAYFERRGVRDRSNHNRAGLVAALQFARGVLESLFHLPRLRRSRVLVVSFPRRRMEEGAWVDPFTDPLIDALGEPAILAIEKPFVGVHCRPPRTHRLMYYDWVVAVSAVAARAFAWTSRRAAGRELSALAHAVAPRLGIAPSAALRLAARELVRFRVESWLMRAAMRVIRPEVVLLTSRWVHLPVIHAAKRSGARVAELQHGVPNLLGYKYSTVADAHVDPDWMLTFGEYWNDFDWGLPRDRVAAIGYRHLWQRRSALASRPGAPTAPLHDVMLVSQPEMSSRLAGRFEEIVDGNRDLRFLLKLHPQDIHGWAQRYPVGRRPNVVVCDSPSADILELFSKCRAVVGHNSTALFEASFFGLRVGILNWDGTNDCPALRYAGRYNLFELRSVAALRAMLSAPATRPETGNPFLADFDARRFAQLTGSAAMEAGQWP